jgi:hypothetical protein
MFSSSNKTVEILWDTGATLSVTPHKTDYVTTIKITGSNQIMKGIAKGFKIQVIGEVEYNITTIQGDIVCIRTPAYYVPESNR